MSRPPRRRGDRRGRSAFGRGTGRTPLGSRLERFDRRRGQRDLEIEIADDEEEIEADRSMAGVVGSLYRKLGAKGRFMVLAVLIGLAITVVSVTWERYAATPETFADHRNKAQVALGASLYRANCAFCHGDRLEGQPDWDGDYPDGGRPALPLDGSGPIWRLSDFDLFDVVKYGGQPFSPPTYKNDMPSFEFELSDADIWALVAFMKSAWPEAVIQRQEEAAEIRREQLSGG